MSKIKKLRNGILSVSLCFVELFSYYCITECVEASDKHILSSSEPTSPDTVEMQPLPSQEPTPEEIEAVVRFVREHPSEPDPNSLRITLQDPDGETVYEIPLIPPQFKENSESATIAISQRNANVGYLRTCKLHFEDQIGYLEALLEKLKIPAAEDYLVAIKHFLRQTRRHNIISVRDFLIYYQRTVKNFKQLCQEFQRSGPIPMPAKIMILRYNLEQKLDEACREEPEVSIGKINTILEQLDRWLSALDEEIEIDAERIDKIDIHLNFRKKFAELISNAKNEVCLLASSEITPITIKENLLKSFYELSSILPHHYNEFLSLLYQIELKFEDFGTLVRSYIGTVEIVPYSNPLFETSADTTEQEQDDDQ